MSQAGAYEKNVNPSEQPVLGLIGNDSVVVPADPATGDIYVIGASGISTSGNAGTYTLTITGSSTGSTINGDSGSIAGPDVTIYANQAALNSGATVAFVNSGTVSTLNLSDANGNTILGSFSGNLSETGEENSGVGSYVLASLTNGSYNFGANYSALYYLTSGSSNNGIGQYALGGLVSGNYNTAIGDSSGSSYTGSESGNILLNSVGVNGESNTLHIGSGTGTGNQQLQAAYISGIDSVNLNTANVVVESSDQLGTAVITAGTGISVIPGTNTITISATGSGAFAWVLANSDTIDMAPDTGYSVQNSGQVVFTLPTVCDFGQVIRVAGYSSSGWHVSTNVGQSIIYGIQLTMNGLTSTQASDCVELLCIVANTTFQMISCSGNVTIN